jgi:hypothetical protein
MFASCRQTEIVQQKTKDGNENVKKTAIKDFNVYIKKKT